MHISTRAARAANRKPAGLTVPQATRQARKIVDAVMPGAFATVDSKMGWDAGQDVQVVVTTVTFPAGQGGRTGAALLLADLPGYVSRRVGDSSITITRKVS